MIACTHTHTHDQHNLRSLELFPLQPLICDQSNHGVMTQALWLQDHTHFLLMRPDLPLCAAECVNPAPLVPFEESVQDTVTLGSAPSLVTHTNNVTLIELRHRTTWRVCGLTAVPREVKHTHTHLFCHRSCDPLTIFSSLTAGLRNRKQRGAYTMLITPINTMRAGKPTAWTRAPPVEGPGTADTPPEGLFHVKQ